MRIDGAIIKEQGVTFGIIIVKKHVLSTDSSARQARSNFQSSLSEFSGIPLILAAQDSRGVFEYWGRPDIVDFLAAIHASRIPWNTYTYRVFPFLLSSLIISLFLADMHSELTTHRQVTPIKINQENKAQQATPYQPRSRVFP